jgi:hypothetical protein
MPKSGNGYEVVGDGMERSFDEIRREICFPGQDRFPPQDPSRRYWVTNSRPSDEISGSMVSKSLISGAGRSTPGTEVRVTVVAVTPRQHNLVEPRVTGK